MFGVRDVSTVYVECLRWCTAYYETTLKTCKEKCEKITGILYTVIVA